MKSQRFLATVVLVVLAAAPLALAQGTKPKKKGAKPAASDTSSALPLDTAPPTPPPAPSPEPAPEPSASASASASPATEAAAGVEPGSPTDTAEKDGTRYYFIGARYRGNLIPQFLENLFVNDGGTVYSNSFGFELDMRSDHHSTIPWIVFANYGFGDTLFLEKNKQDLPQNYSDVSSGLSAIYLGLDELWSTPLDEAHHWDFEYGFGVGIGVVFGTLYNDWVYQNPNGNLHGTNGNSYSQCPSITLPATAPMQPAGNPCDPGTHNNANENKVGGYQEKNWFNGGSIPVIFPHIAFPQLSVRYKPVKQFEARLGLGFSITGFWFGISGDYGLEKPEAEETPAKKTSGQPKLHGTF